MNEDLDKTFALIIKTIFFIGLGVALYYYMPQAVWVWIKLQAEWAVRLFRK